MSVRSPNAVLRPLTCPSPSSDTGSDQGISGADVVVLDAAVDEAHQSARTRHDPLFVADAAYRTNPERAVHSFPAARRPAGRGHRAGAVRELRAAAPVGEWFRTASVVRQSHRRAVGRDQDLAVASLAPDVVPVRIGSDRNVLRSRRPPERAGGQDVGLLTLNMNDLPVRIDPEEAEIGRPTPTARRLVEASVSPNTRRAYAGALRRLDAWLAGRELDDVALAAYLAELHDAGRASSSASMAVAAACFRAKLSGESTPAGERTARVLAGYRRTASDRGRGQAQPFGASDLAAVLATCHRPRRRGRGVESEEVALERGRLDAVIAGLLFMAGMRRSEVSALRWADIVESTDGDGMLVTVRRSKTNQEGETNDVRFVKDGVARALRALRAATSTESGDRAVPLSAQMIGLRFTAAAAAAGVESRVTAHSGRVGLASELTSRGASTTDVMLAGNWKTSRMVAHYSAGATAERGAVARYL